MPKLKKHKLAKQALTAQQEVNTAKAKADGIKAIAKAEADAIALKGAAEATAIDAKAKALRDNPLIVELTKAQNWNGNLPSSYTAMGDAGALPILDITK